MTLNPNNGLWRSIRDLINRRNCTNVYTVKTARTPRLCHLGMTNATQTNQAYYGTLRQGREDYWHKMAAPRHRVDTILKILDQWSPSSIIDLGCGNGALIREIRRRYPLAVLAGADLSAAQIAQNQTTLPTIEWHCADLTNLDSIPPSSHGRFDVVIASEIIEHVDEPNTFLRSALAFIQPRGRLILSSQSGPIRETERRAGHHRHFDTPTMENLLAETGWIPEKVWNTGFPFHDLSKWYANLNPDRTMRQFGEKAYGWRENLVCSALRLAFRFNSKTRGAQLFATATAPQQRI